MFDWAKQRSASLEATADLANVGRNPVSKKLFPAVDDLYDPEEDPSSDPHLW